MNDFCCDDVISEVERWSAVAAEEVMVERRRSDGEGEWDCSPERGVGGVPVQGARARVSGWGGREKVARQAIAVVREV
jgi:hypothetical protein